MWGTVSGATCAYACEAGFIASGASTCSLGEWTGGLCKALVDECADGSAVCGDNTICTDTPESYECSCDSGFEGDTIVGGAATCVDVNECGRGEDDCSDDAVCTNTAGSFECACNEGFTGMA